MPHKLSVFRRVGLRSLVFASPLLLVSGCVGTEVRPRAEGEIEEKRDWVEEVRQQDFFFWDRYFRRLDGGSSEFQLPSAWFRPSELIEGAEGQSWIRASSQQRTIDASAWEAARAWAFDRNTQALLVARGGVIEYEHYGEGYHPGSLLSGRSITKAIVAILTGIALEKGLVRSIDDQVGNYLKEWQRDPRGEITLRQLLTFSSGLESGLDGGLAPTSQFVLLAEGSNVNGTALGFELDTAPDAQMQLNNADTQLAGLVLERVSGKRFAEIASSWLWRPLGAGTATVNLDGLDGDARTFCCMRMRPVDMLRLGQLLANQGYWQDERILSPQFVDEMLTPSVANPLLGLSVFLGWDEDSGPAIDGDVDALLPVPQSAPFIESGVHYLMGGGSIAIWVVPSRDLVVLRWGFAAEDWDNSYIINELLKDIEPGPIRTGSSEPASGVFRSPTNQPLGTVKTLDSQ